MEKSRDIAILKTMGASSRSIRIVFVLQGGIIGAVGTVVARPSAVSRCPGLRRPVSVDPVAVEMVYDVGWPRCRSGSSRAIFSWSWLGSLVVCLLATLYPSRQASRLDPAEALRYQ